MFGPGGDQRLLNEVVATAPTIGSNVEEIVYKNIKFVMWDIGGQEAVRSSWTTYYVNTHVRPPSPPPLRFPPLVWPHT